MYLITSPSIESSMSFFLKARTGETLKQSVDLKIQPPDTIYFMGICGTAMASLAVYLKERGFNVLGSDQNIYPPMSDRLRQAGISVLAYNKSNILFAIKLIVVGNVISKNHEEIKAVRKREIPCLSLPEFLEQTLLSQTKNIVIAGTHGKSTSTALMSHVAEQAGQTPGFFMGAVPKNFPLSFRSTASPYFVIEGDEYDTAFFAKTPKFFYYRPFSILLTGIEFDHGDIYKNLNEITELFCQLVQKIPPEGCLVACAHNRELERLIPYCKAPVITYGMEKGDYTLKNRYIKNNRQNFDIHHKKEVYLCSLSLFGLHNALNALAVFALSQRLGWPSAKILQALKTFKGIKRRMDFKGRFKGADIYEDFAHHPTAVKFCLSAFKETLPDKRLIALFEPRSFTSRLNVFQKDYREAFAKADCVFIAKAYDNSKIPKDKQFSPEKLVQDLKQKGKRAFYFDSFKDLELEFRKEIKKEDVAVFMSSGYFGGLLQKLKYDL